MSVNRRVRIRSTLALDDDDWVLAMTIISEKFAEGLPDSLEYSEVRLFVGTIPNLDRDTGRVMIDLMHEISERQDYTAAVCAESADRAYSEFRKKYESEGLGD